MQIGNYIICVNQHSVCWPAENDRIKFGKEAFLLITVIDSGIYCATFFPRDLTPYINYDQMLLLVQNNSLFETTESNMFCSFCFLALSRMYSNSRRNFICRMRCGQEESDTSSRGKDSRLKLLDDEYAIVHCTGYIKVRQFNQKTCCLSLSGLISDQSEVSPHFFIT